MDAATEWIAPYWSSWPLPDQHQAAVWILNPSDTKPVNGLKDSCSLADSN
jgi:hypothetical protein